MSQVVHEEIQAQQTASSKEALVRVLLRKPHEVELPGGNTV